MLNFGAACTSSHRVILRVSATKRSMAVGKALLCNLVQATHVYGQRAPVQLKDIHGAGQQIPPKLMPGWNKQKTAKHGHD